MDKRTNSQTIGLIALMTIVTGLVAFFSLRTGQPQPLPPLTLREPPPVSGTMASSGTPPFAATSTAPSGEQIEAVTEHPVAQGAGTTATPGTTEVVVHVAGAVQNPGVYRLRPGSRWVDAVTAAGGPTSYANTDGINLAAVVSDGSKVYVPQQGEHLETETGSEHRPSHRRSGSASLPDQSAAPEPASLAGDSVGPQTRTSTKITESAPALVNINTAELEELQRLPGIGPALAQRIIDYRQTNGAFKNPEELKGVSGIGDKKFSKLEPYVTVN